MRWQLKPAAKVAAYFIRLHRDKKTGWAHVPDSQFREEMGRGVSSEAVTTALRELKQIGSLEAKPELNVKLTAREKRKGRAYRLHSSGLAYEKRKGSKRVIKKLPPTLKKLLPAFAGPKEEHSKPGNKGEGESESESKHFLDGASALPDSFSKT
jgi:hypothetical protein